MFWFLCCTLSVTKRSCTRICQPYVIELERKPQNYDTIMDIYCNHQSILDNTRGQVARRTFCGIKKWWVFENRNLRFWNLDFPKLTISIFRNWTFRVLVSLLKFQKLFEVCLMLSLVRRWAWRTYTHTDRQTDTRTSSILGVVYTKGPSGKNCV